MQPINHFSDASGFMHSGGLPWLHVASDVLIVFACYSIPLTLFYLVRQRKDLPYPRLLALFGLFVLACGTNHLLSLITPWMPLRWLGNAAETATALLAVTTALALICAVPRALLLRSPAQLEAEVAERKQAESALRAMREELQEAQRIAHVGSWRIDVASNHIVWSEEAFRLFGLDPTLPPPSWADHSKLFTPESWTRLDSMFSHALATGSPLEMELETVRLDGSHGWMLVRGEAVRDENGAIVTLHGVTMDITERKQAETALKLHKIIIDTTQDGFWMCDTDGKLIDVNQAYARSIGYAREELIGMNISRLTLVSNTPETVKARIDSLIGGSISHYESQQRHKDGHTVYFEASGTYLAESNAIFCFMRDITERKRVEKSLRESENRFRTLVENSPLCIYEMNVNGRLTAMNRAGLRMLGVNVNDASAVQGMFYLDGVCAEDHERVRTLFVRANAGDICHFEFRPATLPGRTFQASFVPVMNSTVGVERLIGMMEDITERKAAEEEIRNLAFYDALTQLPNRRLLDDRLEQVMAASRRGGHYAALMFMDLDNFKPLNDKHGHHVGDLLLVKAAHRISACVRATDTVARFGGDEFVVVLSELSQDKTKSTEQARLVAEKIRDALAEPYQLAVRLDGITKTTIEHRSSASIGVVVFLDHEAGYDDLLKWADMAMYRAKQDGRNSIRFHELDA